MRIYLFWYQSSLYNIQEPSYLGNIILVLVRKLDASTQIVTCVYMDPFIFVNSITMDTGTLSWMTILRIKFNEQTYCWESPQ